ncbi:MAG: hypothetical protein GQE15_39665 [Archangiaceae bacterium]|nr:hypothetical protein [Archangiaceae bacterium]
MNVITIARQSLSTAWRNRALWLFGFFVAASGGAGAGNPKASSGGGSVLPAWVWPVLVVGALVGIAAFLMHVISEGALIAQVQRASGGETTSVREGFRSGLAHFGVVFRLKVLAGLGLLVVAAIGLLPLGLGLASLVPLVVGAALSGLTLVVLLPAVLTGYLVLEVALRVAVLEQRGALASVKEAQRYLSGRLLESLQLLVMAVVGQAGSSLVALAALIPGALVGLIVYAVTQALVPSLVVGGLVAVPLIIPAIGFGGTLRSTVWTTGFLASRALERS